MFFDHLINEQKTQVPINEGMVYRGDGNSLHVSLDTGRHYGGGNAYFKFTDAESFKSAKRIIRISFTEPIYIVHNNQDKLTRKEIKWLIKALNKPTKDKLGRPCTVWIALIREFNDISPLYKLPETLEIPDYTKLETR